jgi:hypothetical protein
MSTNAEEFDLNTLFKEIGFTDEELGDITSKFQGDKAQKLKESVLRQSDYDRKFNKMKSDLQKEQEDLHAEIEEQQKDLLDEKKKLGTYKTKLEREKAEEHIRAMTADLKIKKASELYAIDVNAIEVPEADELAKQLKASEKPAEEVKSKNITIDDVTKAVDYSLNVQTTLAEIEENYKELFPGKKFPRKELLEQAKKNAAHRDPDKRKFLPETAEEMFEFTKVRAKAERESIEKAAEEKWKKKYEEDLTQALSKEGIRKADDAGPRSTFWKNKADKQETRTREDRVSAVIGARNKAA